MCSSKLKSFWEKYANNSNITLSNPVGKCYSIIHGISQHVVHLPSLSRVCSQVMQSQSFWWFSRQILIKSLRGNRIGCNRGSSNCNTAGLRRFWPNIQPSFCHQLNIQPIIVILMGVSIILNITIIFTIIPIILLPLVSSGSLCSFGLLCLAAIASTFERFRRLLPWNKR